MISIYRCVYATSRGARLESHTRSTSSEDKMPEVKDPYQIEKRRRFWEQEAEFEAQVDYSVLSEEEKLIHKTHAEAVAKGHFTYDDPENGDRVLTRLRHFLKGACCGSACRHCIYDHAKVPEIKRKTRRFNSAFWIYDQDIDYTSFVGEEKVKPVSKKKRPMVTHKMIIMGSDSDSQ